LTINKHIYHLFAFAALVLFCNRTLAQEGLRPLGSNINYQYPDLLSPVELPTAEITQYKSSSGSIEIPFKDDFSYAYKSKSPSKSLWLDSSVYINSGFAKTPLSYGVATFDGLDYRGYPRSPSLVNLQYSDSADVLTSRPINLLTSNSQTLLPSDKLALSFYYQAGGNGDIPEKADSLRLEFYKPNQKVWAWSGWTKTGPVPINYNDSLFKRAFVYIKDSSYLRDGFQFRFKNYATNAGDFDHWNIDYVYLDKNRDSIRDTSFYDISFAHMPSPLLADYSAMPFKQYKASEMANRNSLRLRSNYNIAVPFAYNRSMEIDANNLSNVVNYTDNFTLNPFKSSGYLNHPPVSNATINAAFIKPDRSFDLKVKHALAMTSGASTQFFTGNDTLIQRQQFRNFYAFDDGSAEAGYYVLGAGGQMAVKITLNEPDTIVGARIYFEHVGNLSVQKFKLSVWAAGTNGPSSLLISDTARVLYLKTGNREVPEFTFSTPLASRILSPGTYYVGFQQQVVAGTAINVGFDVNYDHRTSLYFNSGSGWTQSQFYGSLLLRPVFGSFNDSPLKIEKLSDTHSSNFNIYPTPSTDYLIIQSEKTNNSTFELYNLVGQKVENGELMSNVEKVNTTNLNNGVYFLFVKNNGQTIHQQKIIISH
jgi:hypothetical protein